jgi:hypothetical protein
MHPTFLALLFATLCTFSAYGQTDPPILWQHNYGGTQGDAAHGVWQVSDGYVFAGKTGCNDEQVSGNHGEVDYWAGKITFAGALVWQLALGGSELEYCYGMSPTADGGCILIGNTNSNDGDVTGNHGDFDIWVTKVSPSGALEWQRALGGTGYENAQKIIQTSDGGYVFAGGCLSHDGDASGNPWEGSLWVVKLDADGALVWQHFYGGTNGAGAGGLRQTADGGYIVAGGTNSTDGDVSEPIGDWDVWLLKLDALGTLEWEHSYGGSLQDVSRDVELTADGGYLLYTQTYSIDGDVTGRTGVDQDIWVVKVDSLGNLVWENALGGNGDDFCWNGNISSTTDGGSILIGVVNSNDGDVGNYYGGDDAWVVKLNGLGDVVWERAYGGTNAELPGSIQQTGDGGYIMTCTTESVNFDVAESIGGEDIWIVKFGPEGVGIQEGAQLGAHVVLDPLAQVLRISFDDVPEQAIMVLSDAAGRQVLERVVKRSEESIALASYARGMYSLTVRSSTGTATQRLVVQ